MNSNQTVIENQLDLPSVPAVVYQLNSLIAKQNVNNYEIARVIETDQAFTARILKLVNSPFYGFARKITSVDEAITMLGFDAVHQLLLTTSVINNLQTEGTVLNINDFWLHSFGVGVFSKYLIAKQNRDLQNEAFMGGILHDIGRLIFIKLDSKKYISFYDAGKSVINLEKEARWFGVNHQEMGEKLAKKWNFPESLTLAIAHHHTPEDVIDHSLLVSTINIADILCHAMNIGHSGNDYISSFSAKAWQRINISMGELEKIIRKALVEIEQTQTLLQEIS